MATDPDQQWEHYKTIMGKVWRDPDFRQALKKDPVGTLKKEGVEIPPGTSIKVMEDTDDQKHFVILTEPEGKGFGARPFC